MYVCVCMYYCGSDEAEEAIIDWLEASDDSTDEDDLHIGHDPGINDEIHNEYDENQLIDFPDFCEMVRAQNPSRGEVSFDEIDSAFRSMEFVPGQNGAVLLEQAKQVVHRAFPIEATCARGERKQRAPQGRTTFGDSVKT